ncbi:MAG: hypothetical protein ACT4PL_04660 [Phycisphaerales bacterium]
MAQVTYADPPAPSAATCPVGITLDITSHDRSGAFYRALGFEPAAVDRPGMIYETRTLRSPRFPTVELRLRAAFGKRPIGSSPGTMLALTLRTSDLAPCIAALTALSTVRWVAGAPPAPDAACAELLDPDGYHLVLTH